MHESPSIETLVAWMDELSNWDRWPGKEHLGALNYITPGVRAAAAALVREGVAISCAHDIDTIVRPENVLGTPQRYFVATPHGPVGESRPRRDRHATEFLGLVFHGYSVTHLDAPAHYFWDGKMFGGLSADLVTSEAGAMRNAVTGAKNGIVTRGVLLDVAAAYGLPWLEPGTPVTPDDLMMAEERQGVVVGEGDAVLLRTGNPARVRHEGVFRVEDGVAGWHPSCLPWLHERRVAAVGSDVAQDVRPSGHAEMSAPIHAVGIVAMGLWLVDNCDLEALAEMADTRRRWAFQLIVSPLRVVGGTGSPVNPVAVF